MKSLRIACAMSAGSVTTALACWQTEISTAVLRANSLNLRATDDGKAQGGMKFELRTAIRFDVENAYWTGACEKKVLKFRTPGSQGLLSFGEVKGGLYWVVPEGGRLANSRALEVSSPVAGTAKRTWLKHYGDGCLDVSVENADQERNGPLATDNWF